MPSQAQRYRYATAYEPQRPSYGGSRGGGTLIDLILARGDQQAEAARRSGDIWGNALTQIGQGISTGITAHAEEKKAKVQHEAFERALGAWDGQDPQKLYGSLTMLDPKARMEVVTGAVALRDMSDKADAKDQERFATVLKTAANLPRWAFDRAYPAMHPKMSAGAERFLGIPADTIPGQPSDEVYETWRQVAGVKPQAPLQVSPNETLVDPTTHKPLYTAPPAPAKPPEPPAVGSFEDYVVRSYGDKPTPDQIVQARKKYQQADDRPRITVNTGAGAESGDVVADAWAAGMAFPSTQAATTAALESFKRRGLPTPRKLSVAMQQDVIRSSDTLQTIEDVRAAYEKVKGKTGPISYRFQEWQTKIPGLDADPDFVTFNTMLRGMGNLEIKRITGAQMSESEADRLLKGMATGTLKPGDFEAALSVMERNARRNRDITLYGKADATSAAPKSAAAPGAQGGQSDVITTPDGKKWKRLPDGSYQSVQ